MAHPLPDVLVAAAAACAVDNVIRKGAALYRRDRDLPKLFHISENDLRDDAVVLDKLRAALRQAQNMARAGHWAFDPNRLLAIRQALAAEEAAISATEGGLAP